jgi:hypothetical protein
LCRSRIVRFGLCISSDLVAVHVKTEDSSDELEQHWDEWVREPARKNGMTPPQLLVLASPAGCAASGFARGAG